MTLLEPIMSQQAQPTTSQATARMGLPVMAPQATARRTMPRIMAPMLPGSPMMPLMTPDMGAQHTILAQVPMINTSTIAPVTRDAITVSGWTPAGPIDTAMWTAAMMGLPMSTASIPIQILEQVTTGTMSDKSEPAQS